MHFALRINHILTESLKSRNSYIFSLVRKYFGTMRLVQFEKITDGRRGIGVELSDGGNVVDLASFDSSLPRNAKDFIEAGESSLSGARRAVESGTNVLQRDGLRLLAPIDNPEKIICIGMNYKDHCAEQNLPVPEEPVVFSKFNSSITGPYDKIKYPVETKELDWEVELAFVIGKEAKNVHRDDALKYVFGYTVAHDVSARDWQLQRNGKQFLIGKSMDAFCPLGPAIVHKDDIEDPHNLKLWTKVNGVYKQDSSTNQLVFNIGELVEFVSRFFTLKPGDVILTGTPPGVGVFRKPPEYLQVGDVVEVGIEKIGVLRNEII